MSEPVKTWKFELTKRETSTGCHLQLVACEIILDKPREGPCAGRWVPSTGRKLTTAKVISTTMMRDRAYVRQEIAYLKGEMQAEIAAALMEEVVSPQFDEVADAICGPEPERNPGPDQEADGSLIDHKTAGPRKWTAGFEWPEKLQAGGQVSAADRTEAEYQAALALMRKHGAHFFDPAAAASRTLLHQIREQGFVVSPEALRRLEKMAQLGAPHGLGPKKFLQQFSAVYAGDLKWPDVEGDSIAPEDFDRLKKEFMKNSPCMHTKQKLASQMSLGAAEAMMAHAKPGEEVHVNGKRWRVVGTLHDELMLEPVEGYELGPGKLYLDGNEISCATVKDFKITLDPAAADQFLDGGKKAMADFLKMNEKDVNRILDEHPLYGAKAVAGGVSMNSSVSPTPATEAQECGKCFTFRTAGMGRECGECAPR